MTEATKLNDHRFLDEVGDTTFFAKDKQVSIGEPGVSLSFGIGMAKINAPLADVRAEVVSLQNEIANDKYLNVIPSVKRKVNQGGFFFHASDDPPEVRQIFYRYLKGLDCSLEIVIARKILDIFAKKHNHKEAEFYADVLSHLIKNKLHMGGKLVLNVSCRANSTSNKNLATSLDKAIVRVNHKREQLGDVQTEVVFNVQNHRTEPLLNVADYLCWSVQRVFERGETRYYDFLGDRVKLVVDIYDSDNYEGSKNYYRGKRRLTSRNKLSPPSS